MWCHAERNTKDKNDSIGQEKGAFLSKFKVATDPYFLSFVVHFSIKQFELFYVFNIIAVRIILIIEK
jgi:hypothetical protein